ncbi:MAG: SsrA-binding protein, partial [Patescibacteria group bacterium]
MKITNPKAHYNYEILETLEAGIDLLGSEVKSVRAGQVSLGEAFVHLREGEAYLINCHV